MRPHGARAAAWAALLVLSAGRAAVAADPPIAPPPQDLTGSAREQTARNIEWRIDTLRNRVELLTEALQAAESRTTFLLQAISITAGLMLGFGIFSCWLAGRHSRLP